jgi:GT2 family glycosyltransferase
VIELPENRGFAAGIRAGLAATSGRHVMWLNPDSKYRGGSAAVVLAWMDAHPDVGVVGGRTALGARYSILTKWFPGNPYSRKFLRTDSTFDRVEPVDWVSGAFLIHTREISDRIGGPDDGFFMYFEDVDFCFRVWRAGAKVYFHPGMTVEHRIGGSSRSAPARLLVARHRSLWRWYAKHFRRFWLKDAVVWLGIWVRCGTLIAAGAVRRTRAHG